MARMSSKKWRSKRVRVISADFQYKPFNAPWREGHAHGNRITGCLSRFCSKSCSRQLTGCTRLTGRPLMAPEPWWRVLLRRVLYTVRRERLLMEHLDANTVFRWFVGFNLDNPI
jgi:transposase